MGKEYIKKYIILGSAFTIAAAALMICLPERFNLAAVLSPAFLATCSVASLWLMDKPQYENFRKFMNAVLLTNMGKMALSLAYIAAAALLSAQGHRIPLVCMFLTIYAVFAVLDTKDLLRIFKEKDSNSGSQK